MEAANWISIAGIAVSGGFAAWSAWSSRNSKKARTAAEDAERRANTQVGALVDIAAAMKVHADVAREERAKRAQQISDDERSPWRVLKTGRMSWDLVNRLATPKYGIQFGGPAIMPDAMRVIAMIPGKGSVNIRGAFVTAQSSDHFTVTWHLEQDLSDEPLTWDGRLV